MDNKFKVKVNDTFDVEIDTRDVMALDVVPTGKDSYHILRDYKSRRVEIRKPDFLHKIYTVSIDNTEYRVKISDGLDQLIEEMGFAAQSTEHILHIKAPMPGMILDIQVEPGQQVRENDSLLILEAMKMENTILSPRDGVIKSVTAKKGDAIDKGHLLIEFE